MTPEKLDELYALAKKASPGDPWYVNKNTEFSGTPLPREIDLESDRNFIEAFSPDVVTDLIDRVRELESAVELAEVSLNLALEYWQDRQQRYKNRSPVWVQKARAALNKESK